jgi:peptide chain release factor 2
MLIDDLRSQLKALNPDIDTIESFWQQSNNETEYQALHQLSSQENFWQNPDQTTILKKLQALKNQREQYLATIQSYQDFNELLDLFESDETELQKLDPSIRELSREVRRFKITLLLSDEDDNLNCFFTISAGAGGTESQDWANMLLRMYLRFCEREHLKVQTIDYQPGEEAGIKSATLLIKGKNSYGLLKNEHGIHRLVRISPFDSNKRRHTSFAGVFVIPESTRAEIEIDPQDLRIDTYRSSGAGGQHVNTTDSAVRITHLPTGIVVQCQNERSQTQNKETAMKMLMAKLIQKQKEEERDKTASVEKKKIEWGSQIRSYVLHPYKMVKDHRTDHESPQPDLVLDGDLMIFIEQNLIRTSQE